MEQTATQVPVFTLGDRLRKARDVTGMSQQQMATSLGIGRRSVSRYEDGDQEPKRGVVMAWSMVTGVPYRWLAEGVSDTDPNTECELDTPDHRVLIAA